MQARSVIEQLRDKTLRLESIPYLHFVLPAVLIKNAEMQAPYTFEFDKMGVRERQLPLYTFHFYNLRYVRNDATEFFGVYDPHNPPEYSVDFSEITLEAPGVYILSRAYENRIKPQYYPLWRLSVVAA